MALEPEVVLPETAHVAFDKAAHYFGLKIRRAPIDQNGQVAVKKVAKLINRKTVLIVGSAPQYPHGTVDHLRAWAAGEKHNVPCMSTPALGLCCRGSRRSA